MEIKYWLASNKKKPNKIMKYKITPFLQENGVKNVLDFGAGKFLRDTLYLVRKDFVVDAVDVPQQLERIELEKMLERGVKSISSEIKGENYDAALLNYVLQTIETEEKRIDVLEKVVDSIKPNGYLVSSHRSKDEVDATHRKRRTKKLNDGYVTNLGTFIKGFSLDEIEDIMDAFNIKIIETYFLVSSYIILGQKK